MKKVFLFFAIVALNPNLVSGQTTDAEKDLKSVNTDTIIGWKKGGLVSLNFGQASFTNWASGGQNSLNANGLVGLFANYYAKKYSWDNSLNFGYGVLKQGINGQMIKTDDKIDFTSKYGRKASGDWFYAGLLNFRTQMTNGYNYPNDSVAISKFMAPGYLLGAIGMDYKPTSSFSLFIAPLTTKITFVNDQVLANAGAFGVDPATYDINNVLLNKGKTSRMELGGYLRMTYKKSLMENVNFQTEFDLFSNYLKSPQNIDVYWENLFAFKVNKFLQATVSTTLIYDNDINISVDKNNDGVVDGFGPRVQFKEVFAIGLSYKF